MTSPGCCNQQAVYQAVFQPSTRPRADCGFWLQEPFSQCCIMLNWGENLHICHMTLGMSAAAAIVPPLTVTHEQQLCSHSHCLDRQSGGSKNRVGIRVCRRGWRNSPRWGASSCLHKQDTLSGGWLAAPQGVSGKWHNRWMGKGKYPRLNCLQDTFQSALCFARGHMLWLLWDL